MGWVAKNMYTEEVKLYALALFGWLDQFVDGLQHFLTLNVILAPLLLLFVEECGVPLPINGDIILAYTGYRLSMTPHGPAIWEAFLAAQIAAFSRRDCTIFPIATLGPEDHSKTRQIYFPRGKTHSPRRTPVCALGHFWRLSLAVIFRDCVSQ